MGRIRITGLEPRAVTEPTLKAAYERIDDPKMQDGNAFFSRQTFQINGKNVTVRVYYADSAAFNNRSKSSLTSIGDGMNCTFEHICSNDELDAQISYSKKERMFTSGTICAKI